METVQTLFHQKYVHIALDRESHVLITKWIGFLQLEEVMEGCRKMIDIVQTHPVRLNLSDQAELKVLKSSVQNYLIGEAFPKLHAAGLEKIAVLTSDDVFTQATVENVNGQTESGELQIAIFATREACYEWLLE